MAEPRATYGYLGRDIWNAKWLHGVTHYVGVLREGRREVWRCTHSGDAHGGCHLWKQSALDCAMAELERRARVARAGAA